MEFSLVSIEPMGASDFMLFALLTLANASLLAYVQVRRERRNRQQRMMRSLRNAIGQEAAAPEVTSELAAA
jgi:hypothetical protein